MSDHEKDPSTRSPEQFDRQALVERFLEYFNERSKNLDEAKSVQRRFMEMPEQNRSQGDVDFVSGALYGRELELTGLAAFAMAISFDESGQLEDFLKNHTKPSDPA